MARIESEDLFRNVANRNIGILNEYIDETKVDIARHTFDQLKDIVSNGLRAQAGFMNDYINDQLVQIVRSIIDIKSKKFENTVIEATNGVVNRIKTANDEQELNRILNYYEDEVTDNRLLSISFDDAIYEYVSGLRKLLLSKFEYMYSRRLEQVIDDICNESKSYLIRYFAKIESEFGQIYYKIIMNFNDTVKEFLLASKKFGETDISFTPGFDEYTFKFNGDTIIYRYDGNELNAYVNGNKIDNTSELENLNRSIQEKFHDDRFPGVTRVTDSMIRRISEMQMDAQINPEDFFNPRAKRRTKPSSNELAFIDVPIRGDVLDNPDIVLTEEVKQEIINSLDIKEEVIEDEEDWLGKPKISQEEIDEMLFSDDKHFKPKVSTNPKDYELTSEEKEALLGSLEIPKTVTKAPLNEPSKDEMSGLQERLDYLLKTPEVIEYLEIQEYLESVNKYKDEVAKNEELEPTIRIL